MTRDQETVLHGMVSFAGVTHVGFHKRSGNPVVKDRAGEYFVILPDGDTEPMSGFDTLTTTNQPK